MKYCPKCHSSDKLESTCLGILSGPDSNRAKCGSCGWHGVAAELVDDIAKNFFRVSMTNPVVHHCLAMHQNGYCDYVKALQAAVVALADQNKTLVDHIAKWSTQPDERA